MSSSVFSSITTKLIIALLALGLIISLGAGSDYVNFGMSDDVIAEVDNNDISKEEFQYFRNIKLSQLPKKILQDEEMIKILDEQIVHMIATRKALALKASDLGLIVSEEELKRKITNSDLFRDRGNFIGFESYKKRVENVFGLDEAIFEQVLIEEILNDKLKDFLFTFVSVSNEEIENKFLSDSSKITFYIIRPTSSNLGIMEFSDKEIDDFIERNKNINYNSDRVFKVFFLNYEDLTKDIQVSQKDIENYIKNYPDEFDSNANKMEENKSKVVKLIRKRIAENLFTEELKKLDKIIKDSTFKDLAIRYQKTQEIFTLTLTNPSGRFPKPLIDELANFDPGINKRAIYFFDNKIWIVHSELDSNNRESATKKMAEIIRIRKQEELLSGIINESPRKPEKVLESVKDDNNYSYEFKYDVTLGDFQRILNMKIDIENFEDKDFFIPNIFGEKKKFIIYVEKVRKANKEFISFDELKIKKLLLSERKKAFFNRFVKEVMGKSKMKLNNKYFNYRKDVPKK